MKRTLDAWFAPAPAERLAAMRLLVGAFALVYLATQLPLWFGDAQFHDGDFRPLGVVRLLDGPLPRGLRLALPLVTMALAAVFMLGLAHRWLAPVFALALPMTSRMAMRSPSVRVVSNPAPTGGGATMNGFTSQYSAWCKVAGRCACRVEVRSWQKRHPSGAPS